MGYNIKLGHRGEDLASGYLRNKSYRIVERNYRTRFGEIDIIAYDKDILVIIEVKTRTNKNYGYAYESVNQRKQDRIIKTSLDYLMRKELNDIQVRYDIMEVYIDKKIEINHIENAY